MHNIILGLWSTSSRGGGVGASCPPLCAVVDPYCSIFGILCVTGCEPVVLCKPQCRLGPSPLGCLRGWDRVRTSSDFRISWRAYLKRLIPEPSPHYKRWTLIMCIGTLVPLMHRCVAHTKLMSTLLVTYLHVLEYGCRHFLARRLNILFKVAVASTPRIPLV